MADLNSEYIKEVKQYINTDIKNWLSVSYEELTELLPLVTFSKLCLFYTDTIEDILQNTDIRRFTKYDYKYLKHNHINYPYSKLKYLKRKYKEEWLLLFAGLIHGLFQVCKKLNTQDRETINYNFSSLFKNI